MERKKTDVKVKLKLGKGASAPSYSTSGSSGMDVRARLDSDVVLKSHARTLVPTGIFFEIPDGYEIQVRPRSGLALKSGITVLNTPGTIDSDYRGELGIILINLSDEDFTIHDGDRIAQIVLSKVERIGFELIDELSETERSSGGFGSTGV